MYTVHYTYNSNHLYQMCCNTNPVHSFPRNLGKNCDDIEGVVIVLPGTHMTLTRERKSRSGK